MSNNTREPRGYHTVVDGKLVFVIPGEVRPSAKTGKARSRLETDAEIFKRSPSAYQIDLSTGTAIAGSALDRFLDVWGYDARRWIEETS